VLSRTLIEKSIVKETNLKNCKTNNKQKDLTKTKKSKFKKKISKVTNWKRNIFRDI